MCCDSTFYVACCVLNIVRCENSLLSLFVILFQCNFVNVELLVCFVYLWCVVGLFVCGKYVYLMFCVV